MVGVRTFTLPQIQSDFQGFECLIGLGQNLHELTYTQISLDMRQVTWFDANMCAPLGAILYQASRRLNTVRFVRLSSSVQKILSKNGFLSNYGYPRIADTYNTTIQYSRFEPKDDRYFGAYIARHFKARAIPQMSNELRKKFWESIFEIFSNAVIHSETQMGIFSCGQFYPNKNRLDFCIADLGIGIGRNLLKKRGMNLPPDEAIQWAMEGRNTTKSGPIPGGLGLKLLREFIRLNQGRIQIVSGRGYWEQRQDNQVVRKLFSSPFPGTVVNIEINTADTRSYRLADEPTTADIF